MVGSLDILGSPTGLVRSVSTGMMDLLRLPYQGLTQGPSAFVTGVYGGLSSLARNVTAGGLVLLFFLSVQGPQSVVTDNENWKWQIRT